MAPSTATTSDKIGARKKLAARPFDLSQCSFLV
jgi:hypothetical protein